MAIRRSGVMAVRIVNKSGLLLQQENELDVAIQMNALNAVKDWGKSLNKNSFEMLLDAVGDITDEVLNGKAVVGSLSEICLTDVYTYTHSVDVAILAIAIGAGMNFHRKKLVYLGVGSILHDLGKTRIPAEILNKPGKLTPYEFNVIKKHPVYGYRMLKSRDVSHVSTDIVLNHHERFDGTGYPRGLKGKEIGDLSYVCAASDVYSAMTVERVYRSALPPHEAYEMIMAAGKTMFDPVTVDGFLNCVVPYPTGILVYLSTGYIAQVCEQSPGLVFRPVVKILKTKEEIDLKKETNIVINDIVSQEDMRRLALEGGELGNISYSYS